MRVLWTLNPQHSTLNSQHSTGTPKPAQGRGAKYPSEQSASVLWDTDTRMRGPHYKQKNQIDQLLEIYLDRGIFIKLMTSDCERKASREASKRRIYGT